MRFQIKHFNIRHLPLYLFFLCEIIIIGGLYVEEPKIVNIIQKNFGFMITIIFLFPFFSGALFDKIWKPFNPDKFRQYIRLFLFIFFSQVIFLSMVFHKNGIIDKYQAPISHQENSIRKYQTHTDQKNGIIKKYQIPIGIVILILFLSLNFVFILEIIRFINHYHASNEVFREFWIIFAFGFLNILVFAFAYQMFGICCNNKAPIKGDILTSLYFSIVTWTTLGYGDLKPVLELRLFAALEALIGYLYMAVLVGLFLNLVQVKRKENDGSNPQKICVYSHFSRTFFKSGSNKDMRRES